MQRGFCVLQALYSAAYRSSLTFWNSRQMAQRGYHYDPAIWHVVMCSIYSDYAEVAKKYGLSGNAEFFADMAHAWLDDKDAVEDKAAAYYCYVVMH